MSEAGILIAAVAGLLGVIVVLIKLVMQILDNYVKKPEDIRLAEMKKDLDSSIKDVEFLSRRNKELEASLADASKILLEFPKLKDQVAQLQFQIEDLKPRVMEYENLSKKYADLQSSYESLRLKNEKLEVQVKSYEEIFVKALALSKEVSNNGTSEHENADPVGSSSDCP